MIPVDQSNADLARGDCFAACIASILEIPLAEVPRFVGKGWFSMYREWLEGRGYSLALKEARPEGAFYIATIPLSKYHAVVGRDGETVHDPGPSLECTGEPVHYYWVTRK